MIYQLRTYEIFETNKDAFHERFRDHAYRIMQRYGFDYGGAWESQTPERTEFLYILRWPDEETMRAAWQGFMSDEEWATIKAATNAEHGDMVGSIQDQVLNRIDELPGRWQ
jgi:hypothetical protein